MSATNDNYTAAYTMPQMTKPDTKIASLSLFVPAVLVGVIYNAF